MVNKYILTILNSDKFNKEAFNQMRGFFLEYDEEEAVSNVAEMIQRQYASIDIESIFKNHSENEIIDFLNRLMQSRLEYKGGHKRQIVVTIEELEEFKKMAEETDKIAKEELSQDAPVLTTKTFLELCRLVYDETYRWRYPDDVSTLFLFCEARCFSYKHEYEHGIFGVDWDSPEAFARRYSASYHSEELRFGGPKLYINDENKKIGNETYTLPKTYKHWTGYVCCDAYDIEKVREAIRMYLILRKNGYPIYFRGHEEVYKKVIKDNASSTIIERIY